MTGRNRTRGPPVSSFVYSVSGAPRRSRVVSSRPVPKTRLQTGMADAVDPSTFTNYVPLNALKPESQRDLAKKASIGQSKAGSYLFKIGEQAKSAIYVLAGEVVLEDASGKPLGKI